MYNQNAMIECKTCCNNIPEKNFNLHQIRCEKQHRGSGLIDMKKQVELQKQIAPIEIKSTDEIMEYLAQDPDFVIIEKEQTTIVNPDMTPKQTVVEKNPNTLSDINFDSSSKKPKFNEQEKYKYCNDFDISWDCKKCFQNNIATDVFCQGCGQLCIQDDDYEHQYNNDFVRPPISPITSCLNEW
jgi:hypothetical protein